MGIFVRLIQEKDMPKNKREIFIQQAETVLRKGGIMTIDHVYLFGKKLDTLSDIYSNKKYSGGYYSYFDEESQASINIDKEKGHIYSDKLLTDRFIKVALATLILEGLYTGGTSLPCLSCWLPEKIIIDEPYVAWLNYVLSERFHRLNIDLWRAFELAYKNNKALWDNENFWCRMCGDGFWEENYIQCYLEILTVLRGTEMLKDIEKSKVEDDSTSDVFSIKRFKKCIKEYKETSTLSKDEQIYTLLETLKLAFLKEKVNLDDDLLIIIQIIAITINMPAVVVKVVSEIYEEDFWRLWEGVSETANQSRQFAPMSEVDPISTEEFFDISTDDLIFLWTNETPIQFSKEMEEWFDSLCIEYKRLMEKGFEFKSPVKHIIDILYEANHTYYHIMAFSSFLNDSLENINDNRYWALWKIFEDMVHDPEMIQKGKMEYVLVEDLFSERMIEKIKDEESWKDNKQRKILRRYLALVANKELRQKVFGF